VDTVISVGAVGNDLGLTPDEIPYYSNSYPNLSFLAPGDWITAPTLYNGYIRSRGTSAAAPHGDRIHRFPAGAQSRHHPGSEWTI
jgi:hypothetical protein